MTELDKVELGQRPARSLARENGRAGEFWVTDRVQVAAIYRNEKLRARALDPNATVTDLPLIRWQDGEQV